MTEGRTDFKIAMIKDSRNEKSHSSTQRTQALEMIFIPEQGPGSAVDFNKHPAAACVGCLPS